MILFLDNLKLRSLLFFSGMLTCLILSIDGFYEFFNGSNILGFSAIDGRIAGLFGDRWLLGRYLIYILPILIGIFFLEINHLKKYKFIFYTTLFLASLTIVFSGERAAFLMTFIYLFLIFLYFLNKLNLFKLIFFIFFIFILFLLPFLFSETSSRIQNNLILYATSSNFDENQYFSIFATSWKMFIDNPIFGIGPNNFRYACSEALYYISQWSCTTHPHSITFQILAETGIFGFFLVLGVFSYFLYKLFKLVIYKKFSYQYFGIYSLQCSVIIYLFPFMITGNFFLSWYGFIFYFPIALFMVYSNKLK